MTKWKGTKRGSDGSKRAARQRVACKKCHATRSPNLHPLPFGNGRGGRIHGGRAAANLSI